MTPRPIFRNGGNPLTICIAGIHNAASRQLIIATFDRRLASLGGWHSSDGVAWKMKTILKGWWALMAGDTSGLTAISYALEEKLKGNSHLPFRLFARLCVQIYKEERERLIETEVLSDYDIDTYTDYKALKAPNRAFYDEITAKILEFDGTLWCMICGFEKNKTPHIFVISGPGKLSYCDAQEFGVIGSGAYAAQFSLNRHPYSKRMSIGECIWAILAAKFTAEAAEGVGPDTVLFVFDPTPPWKMQSWLKPESLEQYKEKWRALPKTPDGVAQMIEANLSRHLSIRQALYRRKTRRSPERR